MATKGEIVKAAQELMTEPEKRIRTRSDELLDKVKGFRIRTPTDYKRAEAMLTDMAQPLVKEIKNFFKDMKASAKRTHEIACEKEHQQLDPAVESVELLKEKLLDYETREQQRVAQVEEQQRVAGEPPATLPSRIPEPAKGISHIEEWVVDSIEDGKVPRQYCSPDRKKIDPVVKALGPMTDIAGVTVRKNVRIAARANS